MNDWDEQKPRRIWTKQQAPKQEELKERMFRKKELLEIIGIKLAHLKATVATLNDIRFFDLNVVAEDFFASLLNLVYGYSLVNLNHLNLNEVAIDLGDENARLAVQVTSERTLKKMQKTVNKFAEYELSKRYDSLKVLIIGDKTGNYATLKVPTGVAFSGADDVIDIARLIKDISTLDVPTLEKIASLIRQEIQEPSTTSSSNVPDQIEINQREMLRQQSQQVEKTEAIAKTLDEVQGLVNTFSNTLLPNTVSSVHQGVLDTARDLLKAHKPSQALAFLEKQRPIIWQTSNGPTKSSFLAIMASAHLANGAENEAARYFLEARQYNPDDEKVLANVAVAYFLLNSSQEAIAAAQLVVDRNPGNVQARSVLIQSSESSLEVIVSETPKFLLQDAAIALAFGAVARRRGDLEAARKWLSISVSNDKDNSPDSKGMLGEAIVHSYTENPTSLVRIGCVDENCRADLNNALRLLGEAVESFADESGLKPRVSWLLNAAIVCRILGENSKAENFLEKAKRIAPNNSAVIYQSAVDAIQKGEGKVAIELARDLKKKGEMPNASIFLSQLLLQSGQKVDAIAELREFLQSQPTLELSNTARRLLIELLDSANDLAESLTLCGELIATNPIDISNLVIASQVYRATGQIDVADATLDKAFRVVAATTPSTHLALLGNELGSVGRWSEASEVLKRVAIATADTPITRKYLHACFRASKLGEVLPICKQLREKQGPIDFITELEIAILEETGDLSSARSVCESFVKAFPEDDRKRVQLAVIYFRQQDYNTLDQFLDNPPQWQKLPMECCQQIAQLYQARQRQKEAIQLLYEIRRKHSSGKVHLQYLQTFLVPDKNKHEWLTVKAVCVDVAVRIKDASDGEQWYILEARDDADVVQGELPLSHRLAKELMEKVPGDSVVLKQSRMSSEMGVIKEIKSKYLHAFHESAKFLEVRFPEQAGGFMSMNLQEGEAGAKDLIEKLKIQQDERQEILRQADELYKTNFLPIGAMACFLGCDIIQAWSYLCESRGSRLLCSSGTLEERIQSRELLHSGARLVIDPISLMTIHSIGLADEVVLAVGRLGIAQSTIDLLSQEVHIRGGFSRRGFMTLKKENDVFLRSEVTEKQVSEYIVSMESLLKWIGENCDVLPWPSSSNAKREDRKELGEIIGRQCLDTVLAATNPLCALYSDDLRLRLLAKKDFSVEGVSTQSVLLRCVEKGTIDTQSYSRAIIQLVSAGYAQISIDGHILIEAAVQSNWTVAPPFSDVAIFLASGFSDDESAVQVATDFIRLLWMQVMLSRSTDYLVLRVLDELTKERDTDYILDKLMIAVSQRFALLPIASNEVMKLIAAWRAIRLG